MRELTNDEIKMLYQYFENIGITYYDILIELVDHYTISIEAIFDKNPALSFQNAFQIADDNFNKFNNYSFLNYNLKERIQRLSNLQTILLDGNKATMDKKKSELLYKNYNQHQSIIEIVVQEEKDLKRQSLKFQLNYIKSLFKGLPGFIRIVLIIIVLLFSFKVSLFNKANWNNILSVIGSLYVLFIVINILNPFQPDNTFKKLNYRLYKNRITKKQLLYFKKQTYYDIIWPSNLFFLFSIFISLYSLWIRPIVFAKDLFTISLMLQFLISILSFLLKWKEGIYRYSKAKEIYPELFVN